MSRTSTRNPRGAARKQRSGLKKVAGGGGGGGGTTLHLAIQALSPLSHWPLRETTGTVATDIGSLAKNTSGAIASQWNQLTAPDGSPAPNYTNGFDFAGQTAASTAYSTTTAGGLTVVFCTRWINSALDYCFVAKRSDGSTNSEWEIHAAADGRVYAYTLTGGSTARFNMTTNPALTVGQWAVIIVRFGASATDVPTIRVNGTTPASSPSGSGSGLQNSTQPIQLGRANSGNSVMKGGLSHVAIIAGSISDAQCIAIEAAADAEGWY